MAWFRWLVVNFALIARCIACRTGQFPIPSNCGGLALSSAASQPLPWVVTVRVQAHTDAHDPEDLLPCPSLPLHPNVPTRAAFNYTPPPDFFFGHPARVAVTHKLTSTCAGVLVTARHVLTVAHCLFASRYKPTYSVITHNQSRHRGFRNMPGLVVASAVCHPGCR